MKGFVDNIEELTEDNKDFRRVLYTGKHLQLVLMALKPGEEIGQEMHADHDQFFRVEEGKGEVWIDGQRTEIESEAAIIVPAGAKHNVINTGEKSLKLYTIYGPPAHRDGIVRATKVVAEATQEHFDGTTTEKPETSISAKAESPAPLSGAGPASQVWRPEHLRLAIDAASVALWSWNVDSDCFTMDQRAFDLWGVPWAEEVAFEELSAHIHPADRDRVRAAFAATRSVSGSYEIDFRIIVAGDARWISARGQGADEGIVDGVIFGIFLDVTSRKQAEEGHELLAGEMSHRVKNLLAIATGLTRISSRSSSSISEMATELTGRLTALGRAHDLVRPLPGHEGKAALLGDLLSVLLAPYDDQGAFAGRIRVSVPRMGVGEKTATALAMVLHELATNAVKYGALSVETGKIDISSTADGNDVCLIWAETGGPPLANSPELRGFGSRLLSRSVSQQLDGGLKYDWLPTGLVLTLRMPKDRLAD